MNLRMYSVATGCEVVSTKKSANAKASDTFCPSGSFFSLSSLAISFSASLLNGVASNWCLDRDRVSANVFRRTSANGVAR